MLSYKLLKKPNGAATKAFSAVSDRTAFLLTLERTAVDSLATSVIYENDHLSLFEVNRQFFLKEKSWALERRWKARQRR
jgi:hypothetical protein